MVTFSQSDTTIFHQPVYTDDGVVREAKWTAIVTGNITKDNGREYSYSLRATSDVGDEAALEAAVDAAKATITEELDRWAADTVQSGEDI